MIDTETVTGSGVKLTCSKDDLVQGLALVARGVSTRMSVQILAGILLDATEGQLALAATDMELSLRTTLDADVEGAGGAVLPGRLLVDLVKLLPASELTLEHRPEE